MVRRSLYLALLAVLLLAFLAPANVALAQKPEPPNPDLEGFDSPPARDMQNVPDLVQKAVALQESLTPEQHAAGRAVLDSYQPEMQAIAESLFAAGKPAADAEPQPVDADIVARSAAMVSNIEADMATVLDEDQMALFRAVTDPESSPPDSAADDFAPAASPAGTQSYTSYCFYSPYYMTFAKYYAYYGYQYAYYNYYYYGGTYAYYAYLYGYYHYWDSRDSLDYGAPGYFGGYYTGMVSNYSSYSYYYWAYYYADYAEYDGYYAYYYAYLDYYYYGGSYAYYSYYYSYYGYIYADYGHYYAYYCYYYW
jgi:hypothetical protein